MLSSVGHTTSMSLYQHMASKRTTGDRFFGIAAPTGGNANSCLMSALGRSVFSLSLWKLWAWALPPALQLRCHCHGCFILLQELLKSFTISNFGFKGIQKSCAVQSRCKHDCRVKYCCWASVRLQQMLGQKINDYRPWKFIVIQDMSYDIKTCPSLPTDPHSQQANKGYPNCPRWKSNSSCQGCPVNAQRAAHTSEPGIRSWCDPSPCEWAVQWSSTVLSRTLGSVSLTTHLIFTKLMLTITWKAALPQSVNHSQQQWNQETFRGLGKGKKKGKKAS